MTCSKNCVLILVLAQLYLIQCQWLPCTYNRYNQYYNPYDFYNPYACQWSPYGPYPQPFGGYPDDPNVLELPNNGNQPNIIVINDRDDDVERDRFQFEEFLALLLSSGFGRNAGPAPQPPYSSYGGCCCNSGGSYCNSGGNCCNSGGNCCNSCGNCCNYCGNCCNSGSSCCNNNNACANNNDDCNDKKSCGFTTHITIILPSNMFVYNKNEQD